MCLPSSAHASIEEHQKIDASEPQKIDMDVHHASDAAFEDFTVHQAGAPSQIPDGTLESAPLRTLNKLS